MRTGRRHAGRGAPAGLTLAGLLAGALAATAAGAAGPDLRMPLDPAVLRQAVQGLSERYGPAYADAARDLEAINQVARLLEEAGRLALTEPARAAALADQARERAREFHRRFPPWLHGRLDLRPERVVMVASADEVNEAVAAARPGDHVVLRPGWYEGADLGSPSLHPLPLDNPVVVRAEVPGTVHLARSSVRLRGGGGLVLAGLVLHGLPLEVRAARYVRVTETAVLGEGLVLGGAACRADRCYVAGRQGPGPTVDLASDASAPAILAGNWLGFRPPAAGEASVRVLGRPAVLLDNFGAEAPRPPGGGAPAGAGTAPAAAPPAALADRFDARFGPTYLPTSLRVDRCLAAEYAFGPNLATGATSAVAESGFGFAVLPLTMYPYGSLDRLDLHAGAGSGVSGRPEDRAMDTSAASEMGGRGGVACSKAPLAGGPAGGAALHSLTIQGWLRTAPDEVLGRGAVLFSSRDTSAGLELHAAGDGRLALWFADGEKSREVASGPAYGRRGEWVFFAVAFKMGKDPSLRDPVDVGPGWVAFYRGTAGEPVAEVIRHEAKDWLPVRLAENVGFSVGARPDGTRAFRGRLDNVRVYAAANVMSPANWPAGVLPLEDLERLRRSDLGEAEADRPGGRPVTLTASPHRRSPRGPSRSSSRLNVSGCVLRGGSPDPLRGGAVGRETDRADRQEEA